MIALEIAAAVLTLVSIWLATRQNIWYYPVGIVSVVMYAWLYLSATFYAESFLQLVYLALMVYGWYEWLHGGPKKDELPVTRAPRRAWLAALAAGVVLSIVTIAVQLRYTDNAAPYLDSSLMAWSLVAQWMTARKWIENWFLWLAVNSVAVPLYVWRGIVAGGSGIGYVTAALYVGLWVLAIVGWRQWRRTLVSA